MNAHHCYFMGILSVFSAGQMVCSLRGTKWHFIYKLVFKVLMWFVRHLSRASCFELEHMSLRNRQILPSSGQSFVLSTATASRISHVMYWAQIYERIKLKVSFA